MQGKGIEIGLGGGIMTIGEIIRYNDICTYRKLMMIVRQQRIKLGDRAERLMQHDAYKRVRGALKQIRWG